MCLQANGDCRGIVRMGWVTFLLICRLTDGKIITDNILYILNVIM